MCTVLKEVTFITILQELVLRAILSQKKTNLSFNALEKYLNPYINGKYHISLQIILLLFFIYASGNILEP